MPDTSNSPSRVMVIAAHPDDPEFGCAGTVVKWAQAGKEITYVLLTSGDKGSHDPDLRPGQLAARREGEQRAAAAELGVKDVLFLRHPDGILENTLELRRQLAMLLRERRPDIVLTIDPWRHYQFHPDHRAAGLAALDAIYAAREWRSVQALRVLRSRCTTHTKQSHFNGTSACTGRLRDRPEILWPQAFSVSIIPRVRRTT